jgi:transposase
MLQLTAGQRILLALEPTDFRKGIDSLAGLCKSRLDEDPYVGTVFAFINRRKTALKVLVFDGNGFWLIMKRFSKGKLHWWPSDKGDTLEVRAEALQILLIQGNPSFINAPTPWRNVKQNAAPQAVACATA